jgi:alkylhydroperoxidase/carboxymuconolactone decarboxylase family protein YurZ
MELKESTTHLAFYAGWPGAMYALSVARRVFEGESWAGPHLEEET